MSVPITIFKPNPPRPTPVYTQRDGFIDVEGDLDLSGKSLFGITRRYGVVTGNCLVSNNKLTSLKGSPRFVTKGFYCYKNYLTSLEGCPSDVGGDFVCTHNAVEFTEDEVRAVCNVKGQIYV